MIPDRTLLVPETPARVKAAVAALLTLLLVIAGALTAPPAHALLAEASVTPTVTAATETGLTVGIEGSGYGELTAAYAAVIEKGAEAQLAQGDPSIQAAIVDGAFSGSLTRTTAALDRTKQYEVIVWQTQSFPNDATIYARADIAVSSAQWDAVFPPTEPEPTDPEPTDPEPTDPEPTDPEPTVPTVTVSKSTGLDPAGDTITVRGSGFDAATGPTGTRPPLAGLPSGVYVAVGAFADPWRPSAGAPAGARPTDSVVWMLPEPSHSQQNPQGSNPSYALIAADGTFEIELPVAHVEGRAGGYGVYTYPGGGAVLPSYETYTALSFAAPAPVFEPAFEVFLADGVTPVGDTPVHAGDQLVVKGTGFDPAANVGGRGAPIPATLPQGTYVVFGSFAPDWQPSAGAAGSTRASLSASQKWVLAESVLDQVPPNFQGAIRAQWVELADDGSFTATLTLNEPATTPVGGRWGVFSYPAGGAINAEQELEVLLNYSTEPEPEPVFEPAFEVFLADGVTPVGDTPVYAGDQLVVKGTGFDPAANVGGSGIPIPNTLSQGTFVVFGKFADAWQPSQGAESSQRTMHTSSRVWALAEDVLNQVPPNFQGAIRTAWAPLAADGSFTATVTIAEPATPLATGNWGVYTYAAGVGTPPNAAQELRALVNYAGVQPATPRLDVTVTDASARTGATVRVVGSNLGDIGAVYAALIEKGTEAAVTGSSGYLDFALPFPAVVDGVTEFTLVGEPAELDRSKTYEVLVWRQHSAPDSTTIYARADVPLTTEQWDVIHPVDVPRVTVSKTTGVDPAGETVTVRGTGFTPSAPGTSGTRPPLAGQFAGTYVVFGSFLETWQPSQGAPSSARKAFDTRWAVPASALETIGGAEAGGIVVLPDGTFETTLTIAEAEGLTNGRWGVYTYSGSGASYAPFETYTPVSFTTVTPPEETPVTPVDPFVPLGAGSLRWAISSSFSDYVIGPIAHGAISVTSGATRANGVFQFGQAAGSTYDTATGTGTVSYRGAVRFTGHNGALDVTIANPQVRIGSASTAALYVTSGGTQVNFATLNLSAGSRTAAGGTVTYTGVPAVLTAAGRSQVLDGFSTTLDAVTFTVGSPAAAPAGSTGTVAAAPAPTATGIPSTPPSTEGITGEADQLEALAAGLPATLTASGFQPNEQDIQVVVYSTPVVLGTVDADAAGAVTWTGSVPATLADGEHTLTFQGSVDRGIRFVLARGAAALDGCVVDAASLRWGFKESFRTYIEGIAAGGWELADVAYEYPDYVWTAGAGTVDAETRTGLVAYGGSIRFTGHGGTLDTTLSDARVELAGDVGYLVFDITGTTQSGEPVTATGVRFARFSLPDLELTVDGLVIDAQPATLTEAGAEAFGTYPAGEPLDPVSAVLPVGTACGEPIAAADADGAPVAAPATPDAEAVAETEAAPVWPWALGGLVVALALGAVVWVVIARRRGAPVDVGASDDD